MHIKMIEDNYKAPFPWFGGKSQAAPIVWSLLGDVDHYIEPFAGSLAVLLNRPHPANRPHHVETVNDADGLLVNFWRAVVKHPHEVATHCSWPVTEADKIARQVAVLNWREQNDIERLMGDPEWCDVKMAGWWVYGVCCNFGPFRGNGAWTVDPVTGRLFKQKPGQGRVPGVNRDRPHLSGSGTGINRPSMREPWVIGEDGEFHGLVMPNLIKWFEWLQARLRHVRIMNGDWSRVVSNGVMRTVSVVMEKAVVGVFLDPPYTNRARKSQLYAVDDFDVADDVREWALRHGEEPWLRIVLAGFDDEHSDEMRAAGWTEHTWFKESLYNGGLAQVAMGEHRQYKERLWASPHCLKVNVQQSLWESVEI